GCYTDSPDARVLPTQVTVSNGLTPEKCVSACAAQGFSYAGVEYMSECWCGSTTPSSTLKADDSTCSLQCTGSSTETCGGAYLIDVYRTRSPVWTTAGCYFDAVSPRLLPDQKQVSGDMTVAKCLDACSEYAFAGVEFATQCFCGPSVDGGVKASDSDCNMPCAGDASVTCGGGNRINVY
ncbi:carbohydrate-binding WSC, partial [Bombardia bombarda]